MTSPIDALLVVPYQPMAGSLIDAHLRQTAGAHYYLPLAEAVSEAEGYVGRRLSLWEPEGMRFGGAFDLAPSAQRSLAAVALATILERAELRWHALDPGTVEIGWYRSALARLSHLEPAVIGISSTFVTHGNWLRALIGVCRRAFPRAKIVVGGSYYATDTADYLSADADVLFVGPAELRLPALVRALRDGRSLGGIRGLYLRREDGKLEHTGDAEEIDLAAHSRPDWRLAERIEPPVDLARDHLELAVETQRGCVFKCEFCTYRTLTSPSLMRPEDAVQRIFDTAVVAHGGVSLTDATATFPRERWAEIVRLLAERGGAPHPVWAYARVNDLDDEIASSMAKANVRALFIGQESGDARMLKEMRKGTRVSDIAPAIRALARHGLTANMSFISGFPGETGESIETTRRLIARINDERPERPTVFSYRIFPFALQDFAGAARETETRRHHHRWQYEDGAFDVRRACREALRTIVEVSRVAHAPTLFLNAERGGGRAIEVVTHAHRETLFHWLKAVDRTMAIFLASHQFGEPIDRGELRRLRALILDPLPARGLVHGARVRVGRAVSAAGARWLAHEWSREPGPGLATRALVAASALRDLGRPSDAARALVTATYGAPAPRRPEVVEEVVELADALIGTATERARKAKLPIVPASTSR
ncbi:MAG: B12-binding domain-containing radical SAM protein [Sandaracinaceae bacterium]|nr:B12-binding domain-containing radical SAM protein [Sandaracinaceae bacterium]